MSKRVRCVKNNMKEIQLEHPEFSQEKVLQKAFKKCKLMEELNKNNRG